MTVVPASRWMSPLRLVGAAFSYTDTKGWRKGSLEAEEYGKRLRLGLASWKQWGDTPNAPGLLASTAVFAVDGPGRSAKIGS